MRLSFPTPIIGTKWACWKYKNTKRSQLYLREGIEAQDQSAGLYQNTKGSQLYLNFSICQRVAEANFKRITMPDASMMPINGSDCDTMMENAEYMGTLR